MPKRGRAAAEEAPGAQVVVEEEQAYGGREYWEERYAAIDCDERGHEWYMDYETLAPLLHGTLPNGASSVLEIGCGDRPLLPGMMADAHFNGCTTAHAIDYAPSVIRAERRRHREEGQSGTSTTKVHYECMDARDMDRYANGSFGLVLDKGRWGEVPRTAGAFATQTRRGRRRHSAAAATAAASLTRCPIMLAGTIDAMLSDPATGLDNARAICSEAARVLAVGGAFVLVSHLDPQSENGAEFLSESLVPALNANCESGLYEIGVHMSGGDEDEDEDEDGEEAAEEEEGDGDGEDSGPKVYVIAKSARKRTRGLLRGEEKHISIEMHYH